MPKCQGNSEAYRLVLDGQFAMLESCYIKNIVDPAGKVLTLRRMLSFTGSI